MNKAATITKQNQTQKMKKHLKGVLSLPNPESKEKTLLNALRYS